MKRMILILVIGFCSGFIAREELTKIQLSNCSSSLIEELKGKVQLDFSEPYVIESITLMCKAYDNDTQKILKVIGR